MQWCSNGRKRRRNQLKSDVKIAVRFILTIETFSSRESERRHSLNDRASTFGHRVRRQDCGERLPHHTQSRPPFSLRGTWADWQSPTILRKAATSCWILPLVLLKHGTSRGVHRKVRYSHHVRLWRIVKWDGCIISRKKIWNC